MRKKFYISDERKRILSTQDTPEDKDRQILELYTRAILETIKYHFKGDSLKLNNGDYNIFLINEILNNTKGKRLYSRYGKFFKESSLNFNRMDDDGSAVELNEANVETVINPHTLEEIPIQDTQLVLFKPEQINYRGCLSFRPNTPYDHQEDLYERMEGKSVKEMLSLLIQEKFKKRSKFHYYENTNSIIQTSSHRQGSPDPAPGGSKGNEQKNEIF